MPSAGEVWLQLQATVPINLWDQDVEVIVCCFSASGILTSYLTTEDPIEHSRVVVSRTDDYASNKKVRLITLELTGATFRASPPTGSIVWAIYLPLGNTIDAFESDGHGAVVLKLGEVEVFEFPLMYGTGNNFQILGSISRDTSREYPVSLWLNQWRLRFSQVPCFGQIEDPVAMMKKEFEALMPFLKHQEFAGTMALGTLLEKKTKQHERIATWSDSAFPVKNRPLPPVIETSAKGSKRITLPFDRIHSDSRAVWARQQVADRNMADLWSIVAALKTEIELYDNQLGLVSDLSDRVDAFEKLLLDMYFSSSTLMRNLQEVLSLEPSTQQSGHRPSPKLFKPQLAEAEGQARESLSIAADHTKASEALERSMRRRDIYSKPSPHIQDPGGGLMERLSRRLTTREIPAAIGNPTSLINRPPCTRPDHLNAAHTLVYD